MIAVGPHSAGLNAAPHAIGQIGIPRPHPGPKAKLGLVSNRQRLGFIFKGGDADNRAKDLLLEAAHIVATLNQRRLNIETVIQFGRDTGAFAAG